MRSKLLIFIVLSFFTNGFSQKPTLSSDFSLEISERYSEIKAPLDFNFGYNRDVLLMKKGKEHLTLQRFNLDGLKKSTKQSQIIEDKGKFVAAIQMEDKAIVFYSNGNKLYAQKISIISHVIEKPQLIINAKSSVADNFGFKSTFGFDAGGRIHKFAIKKSFDGSKILVQYGIKPSLLANKNHTEYTIVNVLDASLQSLWTQQLTMPYTSLRMDKVDFAIDKEGNHYMLVKVFKEELKNDLDAVKEQQDYHVELLKTKINTGTVLKYQLAIDQKSIEEMVLYPDNSNAMSVIGYYKDSFEAVKVSGVFRVSLAEDGSIMAINSCDIPMDLVSKLAADRETRIANGNQEKDDKFDFENLKINTIIANDDNSFTVFSEQRYVKEKFMTTATGIKPAYTYHYRDIFVFKMQADGSFDWFHKLPKHQIGAYGKRSMSFTYMKGAGSYYLIFLDDFKNLRLPLDGFANKLFDGKGGYLYVTAYVVNEESGEVSKVPVINTKDIKGFKMNRFDMDKIIRLSNTDLIIEAADNKKKNFLLKLSVKK